MNPKKISPQYYILSSTTLHRQSLPFHKESLKITSYLYIVYTTVTLKFNGLKVSLYCTIMQNVYPLVRDISLDTKER